MQSTASTEIGSIASSETAESTSSSVIGEATAFSSSSPSKADQNDDTKSTKKVGLGVGVGLGIPIAVVLLGFLAWRRWQRQIHRSDDSALVAQDRAFPADPPGNRMSELPDPVLLDRTWNKSEIDGFRVPSLDRNNEKPAELEGSVMK